MITNEGMGCFGVRALQGGGLPRKLQDLRV
jgi:hypothetical protein